MGNSRSSGRRTLAQPGESAYEISVQPHRASSTLDSKLMDALRELKARKDHDGGDKHDPFTKILLKGPALKEAFDSVRVTFREFDKQQKGFIVFDDMESALNRLGGNFTKAEIDEAFSEADMAENGQLSFKEFLVCLAMGFVLHRIPALETTETPQLSIFYAPLAGKTEPKTLLFGEGNKLRQAFQLAVDVFLWFDMDGDGLIEKEEMLRRLTESMHEHSPTKKMSKARKLGSTTKSGSTCPANAFISQKRFNEMDWDHDGSITFKEFLMAFESWVGVDDDDDGSRQA
ncbi:hypothetical protein SPRG_06811 [Saprolegnia parasitica CBS 223.65]|uniref:EF-hand domain-containing protein n=1 Tax=Saprolegnia parasitica (strain CBS 223.65) TaxID=695850 RepID=A0A067CAK8_SAPPC|nr:hypothetical protein SPRG_06811 [Saprolegnia parasitica CBS 223.65]KDO27543.1 hypothetical protein SPRG_06811 [Saprolegnia parasitica CBS 223.65]|eukprot:XP_012201669.1 hypothetical protein SPRG_06811 [Saprolegnia parasitica CBS 223.65]